MTPVRRDGKSLGRRLDVEVTPAGSDRRLKLTVFSGDTRQSAVLYGKRRFDAVVTDAPYGIVHGSQSDVRGVSGKRDRSPAGLLGEALGVWADQLKSGGALGLSWNAFGLTRERLTALATDAVRMLEVARDSELVDAQSIIVTGGSQGGGITLAAAGLAPMAGIPLAGAAPDVPFLCHFRRATEVTDSMPYGEITQFLAGWRDQVDSAYRTLSYFDGVNLGRRATAPALFSVALMDPVCPPSTVFAAFNSYGERADVTKDINVYSHNQHEGGAGYQVEAQLDWFRDRFKPTA